MVAGSLCFNMPKVKQSKRGQGLKVMAFTKEKPSDTKWLVITDGDLMEYYKHLDNVVKASKGTDYPDTGFQETQWLPLDKEEWTEWVVFNEHYGLCMSTYSKPKQPNAPIMIQTEHMNDCATVVLNYHQFVELYKQIRMVGHNTDEKYEGQGDIDKMSGRDKLRVFRRKEGLLVERVFISAALCKALSTPHSTEWVKLTQFFKRDVVLYPKYIPGFWFKMTSELIDQLVEAFRCNGEPGEMRTIGMVLQTHDESGQDPCWVRGG